MNDNNIVGNVLGFGAIEMSSQKLFKNIYLYIKLNNNRDWI